MLVLVLRFMEQLDMAGLAGPLNQGTVVNNLIAYTTLLAHLEVRQLVEFTLRATAPVLCQEGLILEGVHILLCMKAGDQAVDTYWAVAQEDITRI